MQISAVKRNSSGLISSKVTADGEDNLADCGEVVIKFQRLQLGLRGFVLAARFHKCNLGSFKILSRTPQACGFARTHYWLGAVVGMFHYVFEVSDFIFKPTDSTHNLFGSFAFQIHFIISFGTNHHIGHLQTHLVFVSFNSCSCFFYHCVVFVSYRFGSLNLHKPSETKDPTVKYMTCRNINYCSK